MLNTFTYHADKATPNTIRFQPDEQAKEVLGQATIYISKAGLKKLGLDGTTIQITIEAVLK